ncbi:MAG: hypothetical protein FWC32_09225, partial [Firmicutes bacterium]|nr:hypothetical protein [Bacillota bacterium]
MFRRTTRMFKKLVVFLVIVTMVTPSVVLGVDYPQLWDNSPWDNLPEIEPFYFDPAMISKMDHFTDGDSVIELEYLDIDHGLDPALIEQILNEQANAWLQDPYVQATLRFHELINGTVPFS